MRIQIAQSRHGRSSRMGYQHIRSASMLQQGRTIQMQFLGNVIGRRHHHHCFILQSLQHIKGTPDHMSCTMRRNGDLRFVGWQEQCLCIFNSIQGRKGNIHLFHGIRTRSSIQTHIVVLDILSVSGEKNVPGEIIWSRLRVVFFA